MTNSPNGRNRVRTLAVGSLAVLAIVLAAATLTTVVNVDQRESGSNRGPLRNLTDWEVGVFDTTPEFEEVNATEQGDGTGDRNPGQSNPVEQLRDPNPSSVVLVVVIGLLVVAGLLYRREKGAEAESPSNVTEEPDDETGTEAIGTVAGNVADRLEDEPGEPALENEVYRAWHEMTTRLPAANHRATTPGEFADAAVEAGLDPADVYALTELFRAVRYGETGATEDREARAVETLRRIEDRYGGDER